MGGEYITQVSHRTQCVSVVTQFKALVKGNKQRKYKMKTCDKKYRVVYFKYEWISVVLNQVLSL